MADPPIVAELTGGEFAVVGAEIGTVPLEWDADAAPTPEFGSRDICDKSASVVFGFDCLAKRFVDVSPKFPSDPPPKFVIGVGFATGPDELALRGFPVESAWTASGADAVACASGVCRVPPE
jgi:hypothetical protein